jgi:hypothetical protein
VFCHRIVGRPANEDIQPVLREIMEVENMAVLHLEALVFRRHVRLMIRPLLPKRDNIGTCQMLIEDTFQGLIEDKQGKPRPQDMPFHTF